MSEQEKKSGVNAGGSAIVVEAQAHHKPPYRPTELEEEAPDPQLRRSRAPAVASAVTEELKSTGGSNTSGVNKNKERNSSEVLSSEKYKHSLAKKLSSTDKEWESHNETLTMAPLEVDTRKSSGAALQPIPPDVTSVASTQKSSLQKIETDEQVDEDSITDEIAELRSPKVQDKHSEWSDDEEAGGLPRSDSRASRMSRAVRQLFCCGVPYEAPSEDNISSSRVAVFKLVKCILEKFKKLSIKNDLRANTIEVQTPSWLVKKKEISWNNSDCLEKVPLKNLGTANSAVTLERKTSVGPCKSRTPFAAPSGLMICIPKKSTRNLQDSSYNIAPGINILICKKCQSRKCKSGVNIKKSPSEFKDNKDERRAVKVDLDVPYIKFLTAMRTKVDFMRSKIQNVLNI